MSLIWVAILGLIVLFIYAVISFALLNNQYQYTLTSNDSDANLYCADLGQCMWSVLRYGLTDNLGLVSIYCINTIITFYLLQLIPINGNDDTFRGGLFTARLIFDLSFFIIVTTIGLNIVFGIIVDSFSELREERVHNNNNYNYYCNE